MTAPQVTLFDDATFHRRQARARQRQMRQTPFLLTRCLEDLRERLLDVNRPFAKAYLIGPFDWRADILAGLPDGKIEQLDWQENPQDGDYDLIISLLHLQSINAVGGWMQGVRARLKPDGLFLASLIGGNSLSSLRQALYAIDTERHGSPTPRIHPMIDVRAAAQLLGHVGLAIPVTDRDRFTIHYRQLQTFAADLRDLGLTNCLTDRRRETTPTLLKDMDRHLRPADGGPIPIAYEIIWMTGWAPHENQQKPLKPGSAKMGLNDALRTIRDQT